MPANKDETQKTEEIVVFSILKPATCSECGKEMEKGSFLRMENGKPLCMECADLDHLWYLPAGDVAVTRRAKKYSALHAVVLRFSRTRGRYERQGLLVEDQAIERAQDECEKDAGKRQAQREIAAEQRAVQDKKYVAEYAKHLAARYPKCPKAEAQQIAEHACQKYSGRVGRSAAAKDFDPETIDLAVRAHIRHVHTQYDSILAKGEDRSGARHRVAQQVDAVAEKWRA